MFRFTIRELVLLTPVVAMGVGWWIDRAHLREQVETYKVERLGKRVQGVLLEVNPRPEPPKSVLKQTPLTLEYPSENRSQ